MIERQFDRITRWLGRSRSAYRRGEYAEAAADAQCAQAELELANQELLLHCRGVRKSSPLAKALGAAVLSVPLLAAPLAVSLQEPGELLVQAELAPVPDKIGPDMELTWVTPDERTLLASIRRSLSEANVAVVPEVARELERPLSAQPAPGPAPRPRRAETSQEVSDEEMFRLMEVGRRALQGEPSALIVNPH